MFAAMWQSLTLNRICTRALAMLYSVNIELFLRITEGCDQPSDG